MSFRVATVTDPGRERDRNEDAVLAGSFDDGSWVIIVCDGMGGHDAGDVASRIAARRIYQEVNARLEDPDVPSVLHDALVAAHEAILDEAAQGASDMGTTAVVARLIGDQLWFGWVGDSRLYLVRDGRLELASADHTVIQAQIDAGQLDPAIDHADHPDAHVLTQALGGEGIELAPSTTHRPVTLLPGDTLVLCSDGLHDLMTPAETVAFVATGTPEQLAQGLVDEANRRRGHDNITVAVAQLEGAVTAAPHVPPVPPVPKVPTAPPAPQASPPKRKTGAGRVTQPDAPLPVARPVAAFGEPPPASAPDRRLLWLALAAVPLLLCLATTGLLVVLR